MMKHSASSLGLLPALLTLMLLAACGKSQPDSQTPPPQDLPRLSIGIQNSPAMAVAMVAQDLGLFRKAGVEVELKQFSAGKFALQAMMGKSIDMAVAGDVPVALAVMQGNDVRVFSQVVKTTVNEVRVVARKDSSSADAKQFFTSKRRKLATSLGGGPEFFTWSYLRSLDLKPEQVEIIGQKPEDMPATLASGSVDAIAVFDPFAFIAEKQLGDQAVTFLGGDVYSELYVLAATPATASEHGAQISAVVSALTEASEAMRRDPAHAQQVVMKYTQLDASVVAGIWKNFDFSPALTPQLLQYWRAEFVWAQQTGKIDAKATEPDFRKFIDDRALRTVAPQAVTF